MRRSWAPIGGLLAITTVAVTAWGALSYTNVNLPTAVAETHVLASMQKPSGLNSFLLAYEQSDHKIRALTLMPSSDRVNVALVDANGGDAYSVHARYIELPASDGPPRKVKKDCERMNPCVIPLHDPTAKASELVFVLRGFKFWRKSGSDANVRRVMARGSVASRKVEVAFVDNGSAPYSAEIEYVYAPSSLFSSTGSRSGERKVTDKIIYMFTTLSLGPTTLITGFDVTFDNGDHHLSKFGIGKTTKPLASGYDVTFEDHNNDDPFHAIVDYATLKNQ